MTLEDIIQAKKRQLQEEQAVVSEAQLREQVSESERVPMDLRAAVMGETLALVGPIMKGSPLVRATRLRFDLREIVREEQKQGASALMVATEEVFFECQQQFVGDIRAYALRPVLLYDYILEPYQLYAAAAVGADAVVLMSGILDPDQLAQFTALLQNLGLQAVVEAHTRAQLEAALETGANIFLINNLCVDGTGSLEVTQQLAPLVPAGDAVISWGCIQSLQDLNSVRSWGANAAVPAYRLFASAGAQTLESQAMELGPAGRS